MRDGIDADTQRAWERAWSPAPPSPGSDDDGMPVCVGEDPQRGARLGGGVMSEGQPNCSVCGRFGRAVRLHDGTFFGWTFPCVTWDGYMGAWEHE